MSAKHVSKKLTREKKHPCGSVSVTHSNFLIRIANNLPQKQQEQFASKIIQNKIESIEHTTTKYIELKLSTLGSETGVLLIQAKVEK